jgi:oxygen-independent coproporphyrinogen-3 oxidase
MHIPFCRRRCFYCDFPIEVVGDKGPNSNTAEAYVSLLKREIAATARTMLCDDAEIRANGAQSLGETVATAGGLETLYIGGGTPSLLAPTLLADLLDAVKLHYGGFAPVNKNATQIIYCAWNYILGFATLSFFILRLVTL